LKKIEARTIKNGKINAIKERRIFTKKYIIVYEIIDEEKYV